MCEFVYAQNENLSDYYLIQRKYENRLENDSTVVPLVNVFIKKAKSEKNYEKLFLGYKDALLFSPDPSIKLKYADSVISVARLTKDESMLSNAYMNKGVVYYFNLKQYNLALDQYLIAYKLGENGKDLFHKNRLRYHIGIVKSYIGYYKEALTEFKAANQFFEGQTKLDIHPNLMFNYQRGYYNSLHQMAICYRNLGNFKAADSIVTLGLMETYKNVDYRQEYAYFQKEKGINRYYQNDFRKAVSMLNGSIGPLVAVDDFATLSIIFSYVGKAELKIGNTDKAINYFKKVDSIFNKHTFMVPELRSMYEVLINYYRTKGQQDDAIYYTQQLVKADKKINKDFLYLSSNVHREYDAKKLLKEQSKSIRDKHLTLFIAVLLFLIGLIFIIFRTIHKRRKSKLSTFSKEENDMKGNHRIEIDKETEMHILGRLDEFEKKHEFTQEGISLKELAGKFEISHSYLSQVINEHKGVPFKRYMIELKIGYITEKLLNDSKYLKYTTEALSKECGIPSRSNFSKWFFEINGIRPTTFIKNRSETLEIPQEKHQIS
ncbi:helix-turn-helix domain-containing protein [Chryseobacterium artocarpi]|uniref:helix-turn-helix domain-containing protein n=1 Tax=Chryseobacterium artocarpi TaxID=1414727 RepID=UPI001E3E0907|nr:helix-turn-helix domain-containing protein [Chryseobacterium artocarpi]